MKFCSVCTTHLQYYYINAHVKGEMIRVKVTICEYDNLEMIRTKQAMLKL